MAIERRNHEKADISSSAERLECGKARNSQRRKPARTSTGCETFDVSLDTVETMEQQLIEFLESTIESTTTGEPRTIRF